MYSLGRYSIYVCKDNKYVNVSRNIDDFHKWILNNVNISKSLELKKTIDDKEIMLIIKRDKIELFKWINYLSYYLMLHDFQVSISMQL